MEWMLLLLIGLFAGTIGAMVGLGGGVIIVPALLYFGSEGIILQGISPQTAVGTSLVVMIFTGLSSTLAYMKHRTIDYKSGFIFFVGSGPGSIIGTWVNRFLDVDAFYLYFGIFIILIAFLLFIRTKLKPLTLNREKAILRTFTDKNDNTFEYGYRPRVAMMISMFVGFLSGLFGVGGGSLLVPVMILLFLFPPHVATATSMFMVLLLAVVSSGAHITLGNVHWLYTFALFPGAWFGAKIGAYMNIKLESNVLVFLLRIILMIIGGRMIYQGLIG